ncbi:EndoU domain-containing protein [Corynebacterium auris]|uniref:VG15 protein n=1 Tax=Corynebacterium auris TaxID=44750 RepID=UPI0025B4ADB3|nr:EndoU domain-containing protein [Corynebacterium auris]WJY67152.1 hypothetical protein CAURIS_01075 [Corynebacterium auris]
MDFLEARRIYVATLRGIEKLALRDWLAWWDTTDGTGFVERRALLEEPFTAIATIYGEQAAYAAADYLFLQRSLDETLAGLAYPEVADPVGYDQAAAAFRAAMRMSDADWKHFMVEKNTDGLDEFNAKTMQKLTGALNRVVLLPARETVARNIAPGMRFARVPEPGACNWCLMIASRGAVFSKDTVGMTRSRRFHDNCRCVGMEVGGQSAPLPRVNRELESAWKKATKDGGDQGELIRKWKNYLDRRSRIVQSQVRFPDIPGVTVPRYTGKPERTVTLPSGETMTVPLPDLHQVPGHVLYGWTTAPPWGRSRVAPSRRAPGDYSLDNRFGHKAGSTAAGTKFPDDWSDQQIVDAIRDILETGEAEVWSAPATLIADRAGNEWKSAHDFKLSFLGEVGGETIRVRYTLIDSVPVQPFGYPVRR